MVKDWKLEMEGVGKILACTKCGAVYYYLTEPWLCGACGNNEFTIVSDGTVNEGQDQSGAEVGDGRIEY